MPRFFAPQPLHVGTVISLPDEVAHHVRVLRLASGDSLTLFNGEGGEYTATLATVEKKSATVEIQSFSPHEVELPYAITLAQGLPEGSKMEWIVEKAVELGVSNIQPLATQRSVVKLSAERAEKKIAHWQAISIAASEQCGRNRLAHIAPPLDFSAWAAQQNSHMLILLSPRASQSLTDWARANPPQSVTLAVGPEGGFTEREEEIALANGAIFLSVGQRVLRTETAGLATIVALNALWGQM